ncbi:MAG: universal stress protein [Desulfovermiculus sp.]
MLKTILFPTDFSEISYKALDTFDDLLAGVAEKIVLLHVVDARSFHILEGFAYANAKEFEEMTINQANANLEKMAQELRNKELTVESKVEVGVPVQEILKAEKGEEISLVVLGSHGKSNVAEMFLGSVAEKVVRKCTKSVLMIKR